MPAEKVVKPSHQSAYYLVPLHDVAAISVMARLISGMRMLLSAHALLASHATICTAATAAAFIVMSVPVFTPEIYLLLLLRHPLRWAR